MTNGRAVKGRAGSRLDKISAAREGSRCWDPAGFSTKTGTRDRSSMPARESQADHREGFRSVMGIVVPQQAALLAGL